MPSLHRWWLSVFEHCRRREAVIALDLVAASIIMVFLDKRIAAAFADFQQSIVFLIFDFIPNRIQLSLLFTFLMAILIFYRVVSGDRCRTDQGMFILGCGVLAGFAADMLKIVFGRPRPDTTTSDISFVFNFFGGGDGFDSFPSSHAAIAASLAGALSTIWPRHRRIYYALAIAVAASRFLTGAHYVSDALLGFAVGLCILVVIEGAFGNVLQIRSGPDK